MEHFERPLSRRQLLQYGAGGLAAASLGPLLAACGGSSSSSSGGGPATLKMWWWGQQEAVGIQKWMQDTIAKFKTNTGNTITPTLMSTDNVIPQFTNAAAAGQPPDIQFLFNGIYHMENVWLGYIAPLDGLVSHVTLPHWGARNLSAYNGKHYRAGFDAIGFGLAYNKSHFRKAGLDP